jgi:ribonuclease HII
VQTLEETVARSTYALPAAGLRIEFSVGGEARTPVALASMTAKYVRELAMRAFNAHWGRLAPGVAPTAGYPVDAGRWRREAETAVERAGVSWDEVWRRA